MVSTSPRWLPLTWMEDTLWAAAGGDISMTASGAATGVANMTRAATNQPPGNRIPNFMRKAPLSFQYRSAPLRTSRFPLIALLVANFAGVANVRLGAISFSFQDVAHRPRPQIRHHEPARCRISL